jgi:hypothetical protein
MTKRTVVSLLCAIQMPVIWWIFGATFERGYNTGCCYVLALFVFCMVYCDPGWSKNESW